MSFLKSCLDTLLKPAADPRQGAVYTDERQRAMLLKVRSLLADIDSTRQQHTRKTAVLAATIAQLEKQARADLANGREDLARRRLQQQQMISLEQQQIQIQIGELDQEEERLRLAEHRLLTHIEAYIARREALLARYSSAETQVQLNMGLQKLFRDLASLEDIIELAETQTDQMETRASLLDADVENELWCHTAVTLNPLLQISPNLDLQQQVEVELRRLKEQVV
jgi:phage shock protein A